MVDKVDVPKAGVPSEELKEARKRQIGGNMKPGDAETIYNSYLPSKKSPVPISPELSKIFRKQMSAESLTPEEMAEVARWHIENG